MKFDKNIYEATFINRPNRFNANVLFKDKEIIVHVPNTGRCREILKEGTKVYLREELNPTRKTNFDLIAAFKDDILINIDSQIPNKVVNEALINKKVKGLEKYIKIEKEKTFGKSRFDFKLSNEDESEIYYLEVKGVTLEKDGRCKFPDAPTERGTKHLLELIEAKRQGYKAGVLFLIQIENVFSFEANYERDPKFAEALKLAKENNVDIMVYNCIVEKDKIEINDIVDIIL
ncbi:DNA/RNA nuclease SfsA [Clostridium sp.]|uniref:DNA/RNA nuclease SfsA n=1 Tax=Clostridium sp. TaxID=1506 RepID=UPI00262AAF7A|nr:DNA/RNA nuclease SfsA [Clostridium sp.]